MPLLRGYLPVAITILVAACSSGEDGAEHNASLKSGEVTIPCALDGAADFQPVCAVERDRQGETLFLVIHHPNGGFRRFEVLKNGQGIAVADGADGQQVQVEGGMLTVTVARDRYRLPVTVKGSEADPDHAAGK